MVVLSLFLASAVAKVVVAAKAASVAAKATTVTVATKVAATAEMVATKAAATAEMVAKATTTTEAIVATKVTIVFHQGHILLDAFVPVTSLALLAYLTDQNSCQMFIRAFGVAVIETYFAYDQIGSFKGLKMLLASMKDMMIWQFGEKLFCHVLSLLGWDTEETKSGKTTRHHRIKLLFCCLVGLLCIGFAYGIYGLVFSSNFFAGFLHGLKTGVVWWIGEKLGEYLDIYMKSLDEPDESLNPLSYLVTSLLLSAGVALMELVKCLIVGKGGLCSHAFAAFLTMIQEMLGFYGAELFLWLQSFFVSGSESCTDDESETEPEP